MSTFNRKRQIMEHEPNVQGKHMMTPRFMQLLDQCIADGVVIGHKRAYKHTDTPSEMQINESIVNEVLYQIHEWFDFDEEKTHD